MGASFGFAPSRVEWAGGERLGTRLGLSRWAHVRRAFVLSACEWRHTVLQIPHYYPTGNTRSGKFEVNSLGSGREMIAKLGYYYAHSNKIKVIKTTCEIKRRRIAASGKFTKCSLLERSICSLLVLAKKNAALACSQMLAKRTSRAQAQR